MIRSQGNSNLSPPSLQYQSQSVRRTQYADDEEEGEDEEEEGEQEASQEEREE